METNVTQGVASYGPLGQRGLGGWLIFFQFVLWAGLVSNLFQIVLLLMDYESYREIISNLEMFPFALKIVLLVEVISIIAFTGFLIYVLIIFYRQKARLPMAIIAFFGLNLLSGFLIIGIYEMYDMNEPAEYRKLFRDAIASILFIIYFLRSKRVRNTFVK